MPDIHIGNRNDFLWLLLDRQPLNALTAEMLDRLGTALQKACHHPHPPRLVVISGTGEQAFCTGIDLPDDTEANKAALLRAASKTDSAFMDLHRQNIPTVALVKGNAFGAGCELAALCDTIIAREDALFRLPVVNSRIFPSAVSTRLPALIGQEHTTQLMQSGETLTAQKAMRLGLVQQVLSTHRFLPDTEELLIMLATVSKQPY
jgi:enoyl-CoA hydratase/carnithine racemase